MKRSKINGAKQGQIGANLFEFSKVKVSENLPLQQVFWTTISRYVKKKIYSLI